MVVVENEIQIDIDDLLKVNLEERIYRLKCVEALVYVRIPWIGSLFEIFFCSCFPNAKFVVMKTFYQSYHILFTKPKTGFLGLILRCLQ